MGETLEKSYFFIQCQFCGKHYQYLLSESISRETLQKASLLIHVQLIHYGEQYQTFNAHMLHLAFCIKNIGLLWTFSDFIYIIIVICNIYFMDHSILNLKLLLQYISNKRSQKSSEFFPIQNSNTFDWTNKWQYICYSFTENLQLWKEVS